MITGASNQFINLEIEYFTIENGETLTISSPILINGSSANCGILDFELDIHHISLAKTKETEIL